MIDHESAWYKERLTNKQRIKVESCESNIKYLADFIAKEHNAYEAEKLKVADKLVAMKAKLAFVKTADYIESITGTIGADPLYRG